MPDDPGTMPQPTAPPPTAGSPTTRGPSSTTIHAADGVYDAIIINPGAYTHYSYAILDALKAVSVPAYEVHISHIDQREPFRAVSVTAPACVGQVYGHGFQGYLMAMDYFLEGGR